MPNLALSLGSRSSFRHWQRAEEGMVAMLEREVASAPTEKSPAQCLEKQNQGPGRYLTNGTRNQRDTFMTLKSGLSRCDTVASGTPRGGRDASR